MSMRRPLSTADPSSKDLVHVLFVDDDESLVEPVKNVIDNLGYSITTASSLEEAASKIEDQQYQVIIVDYHFENSRISGADFVLDNKSLDKNTKPIIVTALNMNSISRKDELQSLGVKILQKGPGFVEDIERLLAQTLKDKQAELAVFTLPFSRHSIAVLGLAEQFRLRLNQKNIRRSMLFSSLIIIQEKSPAHLFLSAFNIKQEEVINFLCSTFQVSQMNPSEILGMKNATSETISINPLSLTDNARKVIQNAQGFATAQDSDVINAHLFAALMESTIENPGWITYALGTENTTWIRETLKSLPSDAAFTESEVLGKAVLSGRYTAPVAFRDSASKEDLLGFDLSASALINIILKPETIPPLVIGVYGPWGSGKSTFMQIVKDKLDYHAKRLKEASKKSKENPKLITVHYDAWAYADAPKLWAGLIAKIAKELDAELGWKGRIAYLFKRHSRQLLAAFVLGLIPIGLALLSLFANKVWQGAQAYEIAAKALSGVTGASWLTYAFLLQKHPVSSNVASLTAKFDSDPTSGVIHSIQEEFRNALKTKISPPEKEKTNESQITTIAQQVQQNKLKIVVFIDELDRCPLERIVDILEAIKLFLAEEIFIVFLAIDTRVAAEAIQFHYKEVRNPDLPRQYLEKIIQLPLRMPTSKKETISKYLSKLMNPIPVEQPTQAMPDGEENKSVMSNSIQSVLPLVSPLNTSSPATIQTPVTASVAKSQLSGLSFSLPQLHDTQNEFEFLALIAEKFLESNPRRIKRLLNTYRYVKLLSKAYNEPVHENSWQKVMLVWLAFTIRWPLFMSEAIHQAKTHDGLPDPEGNHLLTVSQNINGEIPKPSVNEINDYLNIDTEKTKKLWELAGNFLIENPNPQTEHSHKVK